VVTFDPFLGNFYLEKDQFKNKKGTQKGAFLFARQGRQSAPLKEAGEAPITGNSIRIARASLATVGSEGSDRRCTAHNTDKPRCGELGG